MKHGKFEWWKDTKKAEPYRWRLRSPNGKTICQSEGYQTKRGCLNGIKAVAAVAGDAEVVEL